LVKVLQSYTARTQAPLSSYCHLSFASISALSPCSRSRVDLLSVCTVLLCSQGLPETEEGAVQRLRTADIHHRSYVRIRAADGFPGAVPAVVRLLFEASKPTAGKGQHQPCKRSGSFCVARSVRSNGFHFCRLCTFLLSHLGIPLALSSWSTAVMLRGHPVSSLR
jgi:hypothetical protein